MSWFNLLDQRDLGYLIHAGGTVPFTADQSMGSFKLTSLGTPTNPTDAATKAYVDSVATGRLITETRYAAAGLFTWTPNAATQTYEVFVKGGGGGGGSAAACPGATASCASGGASGSYCYKRYTAPPVAPVGLTVGAAGAAGGGGLGGGAGTASLFPDTAANLTAPGGGGGLGGGAIAVPMVNPPGTPGGVATGGDINSDGDCGGEGFILAIALAAIWGGDGSSGPWGAKQQGSQNGIPAASSGSGSGGAAPSNLGPGAPAKVGRAGRDGIIIVREYT